MGNQIVTNKQAYDVNGLTDSGYSDYLFGWVGWQTLPVDVYSYTLVIKNCSETINHIGTISNIGSCSSSNSDIQNLNQLDCCPQNIYFSNSTLNSSQKFGADQNIFIGNNSTGVLGSVLITNTSNISFNAGTSIVIDPGELTIQPGSSAQFVLQPCVLNQRLMKSTRRSTSYDSLKNINGTPLINLTSPSNKDNFNSLSTPISIFPNPSDGKVTIIVTNNMKITEFQLFTTDYNKLLRIECNGTDTNVDLSMLSNGFYFIIAVSNGVQIGKSKMVILK